MIRKESALFSVTVVLACLLAFGTRCFGAGLAVGSGSGIAGFCAVAVPVTLSTSGGEEVASGQWDVLFEPSVLDMGPIATGTAALAAGKSVTYSDISPGRVRVIVSGFNLNAISDGEVARLSFYISGDAMEEAEPVALDAIVLSDPSGTAVPATGASGSITVQVVPLPAGFGRWPSVLCVCLAFPALFVCGARRWKTVACRSQSRS